MSQESTFSKEVVEFEQASPDVLPDDPNRRFWLGTACAVGGVAGVATVIPFVASMSPSERAKAAGAPVQVDISSVAPGQMITAEWQGKPGWILRRTPEMLATLPKLNDSVADPMSQRPGFTPEWAQNEHRSIKPEWMVMVGICTHLGCSPSSRFAAGTSQGMGSDWLGGYLCPCHGSVFDFAGRAFKNMPAPDNLPVPPYYFIDDTSILIGLDSPA